jgi:hypothetical protein
MYNTEAKIRQLMMLDENVAHGSDKLVLPKMAATIKRSTLPIPPPIKTNK